MYPSVLIIDPETFLPSSFPIANLLLSSPIVTKLHPDLFTKLVISYQPFFILFNHYIVIVFFIYSMEILPLFRVFKKIPHKDPLCNTYLTLVKVKLNLTPFISPFLSLTFSAQISSSSCSIIFLTIDNPNPVLVLLLLALSTL